VNVIACQVWRDITDVMDPDAELRAAIEAFRQRQLAQINAQLAELGLEPPAANTEKQSRPAWYVAEPGQTKIPTPTPGKIHALSRLGQSLPHIGCVN
jgi:hypothetical protein